MSEDATVQARVAVAGFHASNHNVSDVSEVVLTGERYVGVAVRGTFKKRSEEVVSWPYQSFTSRVNSSEGEALGPFLHFLTLFAEDGETVSAAFRTEQDRDHFKATVVPILAHANGW
jgi:hypothetical protein